MPLTILNFDQLRRLSGNPEPSPARVSMDPRGDTYITFVHVTVGGVKMCLHSEVHDAPQVPAEVSAAVEAFNADPFAAWATLVEDAIDEELDAIADRRRRLREDERNLAALRARLLGDPEV